MIFIMDMCKLNYLSFRYIFIMLLFMDVRFINSDINTTESSAPLTPNSSLPNNTETINVLNNMTSEHVHSNYGYTNRSLWTGNELWDGILRDCIKTTTISCIQKNVYSYLDSTLDYPKDYKIGNTLLFKKNVVDFTKYSREFNEVDSDDFVEEIKSPIEEVTSSLYGKGMKFMMTHDLEMKMPDILFDGATFKVSPRSLEGTGALVKLDLIPKGVPENGDSRLFKKNKDKLIMGVLSMIMAFKLLKMFLMFIIPFLFGVTTAKKIGLKILLFLFPAVAHIFKLCHYYHTTYHTTKYHQHHHHLHSPHHHHPHHHHGEISYHPHPPPDHHHGGEISYTPPPGYGYESNDFELSGPGLGAQYIAGNSIHRNAYEHRPSMYRDENEIKSWGLAGVSSGIQTGDIKKSAAGKVIPQKSGPLTSKQIEELAARAEKEVMLRVKLQQEQLRIQQENARLREQLRHQELLKLQAHQKMTDQMKYQTSMVDQQQKLFALHQQQKILQPQIQQKSITQQQKPIPSIVMPASNAYDPFYSPILEKVDSIFAKMSVSTEGCKERLVCSMYKNPAKFSPHSNLISNELSRDSKELQKPTSNNVDVIRFYKYIQAARDGQEKKDCLKIYPACLVNTEK